ncbi:MAG: MaoC family dehydratase, partial [Proteobacteria bacterium]|nr:MaoC family dehydratase [Pseudomonadota bacterium]
MAAIALAVDCYIQAPACFQIEQLAKIGCMMDMSITSEKIMTSVGMKLAKRIAEGQSRIATAEFASRIDDRYFEDYVQGAVYQFGEIAVSPEEIMDFAKRYDPQDYHTNAETAAKTRVGGLIASGWHTSAMMMRMFCDNFLTKNASLPSPGVDELRWVAPVRPGDIISLRVTIAEARRSATKP